MSSEAPPLSEITVSQGSVCKKVQLLKMNKSTGLDHIPPKQIKLAGKAIVPALAALFRFSIERVVVYLS